MNIQFRAIGRYLISILVSAVVLFPLIKPFLQSGRAWTYDVDSHQFRMAAFHQIIKEGNIPPRWSSQLNYGWGSPVFTFNWSLPYWMGEPFLFAGFSVTDASKAVTIVSIILSYIVMFGFLAEMFGFLPALGGAAIYEWALFRIYLLFTGGGLGMETAFIFWPMLFWAIHVRTKRPMWSTILVIVGTVGTLMSHQVMFLMIMPLFWCMVLASLIGTRHPRDIFFSFVGALFVGLGLTAYFWLPAFVEQHFVHIDITKDVVWKSFLDLTTLFHQPGITIHVPQLQYWYWSTGWNLFVILGISLWLLSHEKKRRSLWIYAIFFMIGQVLMMPFMAWMWKVVPLLSDFQYPVRFQAMSLFCASILFSYCVYKMKRFQMIVCFLFVGMTVSLHVMAFPTTWPRENISDSYYYQSNSTADMMGEYLPRWATIDYFFTDQTRFTRQPIARVLSGDATLDHLVKRSSNFSFTARATVPSTIVINQFYFPGWRIWVNDQAVRISPYGQGEMQITLPQGESIVRGAFTDTPIRTFGNWVTIGTMIGIVGYGYALWQKRRVSS